MLQRTLSIIKPDAVSRNLAGDILAMIQAAGLTVKATKMIQLTRAQAEAFYAVHKERPFYGSLCDFMTSGPVVVSALEGENAIQAYRDLMGATNPANAAEGTIRKRFALDVEKNAVHGSDAPETAAQEIPFFFSALEIVG
ncbi:nucleoside-diphosphate kinase [Megalodesulfovibrio gigas]|uniref:Nucleoside diphosphate kinase n=1 Tax=Megalodesulfovibrio gigas (strain ATCC 19364 / DSM 1382 / NCIMB 9332 / VKM B-1759) TaxID=1121448 RepID=T2GCZ8_MEGG1|nr:nucleoside-diphosphate kinase [Megalodesulfovibrio gigas]AGW14455.1 putative Nucleoside-diphosphate kinase [Megalodesulfovibrio gigas DSM 1382 = ATCC 19364]